MKLRTITYLLLAFFLLTACPDSNKQHRDSSDTHSGDAPKDGKLPKR